MTTKTKTLDSKLTKLVKYCSDYDEDCKHIGEPGRCFLGGIWECDNGCRSYFDMADGICKEMELRR